jgi:hypothetical protein
MTPEPPAPEVTLPLEALREVVNERDMLRAEVARLRDILDAERGVRGREGWEWLPRDHAWRSLSDAWTWPHNQPGKWQWDIPGGIGGEAPTALEAMEAADAARGTR